MMRIQLGGRDRRALRLGALVALPLLAFTLVVRPYRAALEAARDEADMQRDLLARETDLLADAAAFPARLRRTEAALRDAAPRLFRGADDLAATAALVSLVGEQAQDSHVLVERIQAGDAEPAGEGLVRLRADVRATGDLEGVLDFLHSLESADRHLRVERLEMQRVNRFGIVASDGGAEEEVLDVSLTVVGYRAAHTAAVRNGEGT